MDKERFLNGIQPLNDWNNHLILLWLALIETRTGDVLELGCGDGSTRQLYEFCHEHKRMCYSYDNDQKYIDRFLMEYSPYQQFHKVVNNWNIAHECKHPSVVLIDHAPGERRVDDIRHYANRAGILVIHDTQPPPTAADYKYETIWPLFKYRVNLEVDINHEAGDNRTWASAVSNHYDVTKWSGIKTGREDYRITT